MQKAAASDLYWFHFFSIALYCRVCHRFWSPDGLLLYRTYTENNERLGNPRGPRDSDRLLRSQELLEIYRGMKILHYNETVVEKGVAELIAQQLSGSI